MVRCWWLRGSVTNGEAILQHVDEGRVIEETASLPPRWDAEFVGHWMPGSPVVGQA